MNEYNGKSSDAIKADIERTRNEMTEKIDTIQERLSPDNLKMQAQGMVQDIMQESADAISEFVRTNTQQAGRTLVETIKHNPLPSAVIGLGLGWLLMNTVNTQRSDDDRSRSRDDLYGMGDSGRYQPRREYRTGPGAMRGAQASYGGSSLDDVYSGQYGYAEWQEPDALYGDNQGRGIAGKAAAVAGKVGDTAQNIAGAVGGAVQSAAGTVQDAVQDAAQAAGDTAGQAAHSLADRVSGAAGTIGDAAGSIAQPAAQMARQARHQAMSAGRQAAYQAGSFGSETQHQAARAGRTVQRTLEDNPVAFGAAALLAGVAIGVSLPATRHERQLLGDMHDQVMDKAQNMVSTLTEEAKQVVQEVKPRLEETAQKVVEDIKASSTLTADELKRTGKDAGQEIKQALKDAGSTVKNRVEETTGVTLSSAESSQEPAHNDGGKVDAKL